MKTERKPAREIKELLLVDGVFYERTDFEKDCHPITTVHWTCIHTMRCKWFDKCYKQLSLKSLAPTDEEIYKAANANNESTWKGHSQGFYYHFVEGAEWMREKLTGVLINSEEKQKGAPFDEEKTMM